MKENTSATVPGTTVKIAIMKTIEGEWQVTRTAQLGVIGPANVTFRADAREQAGVFANLCWTNTVNARNAQIDAADKAAHTSFEQAIADDKFIIEVRFE